MSNKNNSNPAFEEPDLTKNIRTKEDFINFVNAFAQDFEDDSKQWINKDISSFLFAMANFTESLDGFYRGHGISVPENPDWKMFANMLAAGRVYYA
jgi:hypothetical protein